VRLADRATVGTDAGAGIARPDGKSALPEFCNPLRQVGSAILPTEEARLAHGVACEPEGAKCADAETTVAITMTQPTPPGSTAEDPRGVGKRGASCPSAGRARRKVRRPAGSTEVRSRDALLAPGPTPPGKESLASPGSAQASLR